MPPWNDLPSIQKLIQLFSATMQNEIQRAWNDSFLAAGSGNNPPPRCYEIGGFIYVDPKDTAKQPLFVRATPGNPVNQDSLTGNPVINLQNPPLNNPTVGTIANPKLILVANFHTHPLRSSNSPPSNADLDNNWRRQIPGMIISRDGIFSYPTVVPERETFQRPIEYPANLTTGGTFNYRRETTPGWSLQNAPNQILP